MTTAAAAGHEQNVSDEQRVMRIDEPALTVRRRGATGARWWATQWRIVMGRGEASAGLAGSVDRVATMVKIDWQIDDASVIARSISS